MKLSRRGLLALAGASAGQAMAQVAQPPATPASPDLVAKARDENRQSAENLTKFEIPMSTEPAFVFRA